MISAATLTDDEFDTFTVETQAYSSELYAEILAVLDSREAVSNTRDRLTHYFQARGVNIVTPSSAQSNIFLGGGLCS